MVKISKVEKSEVDDFNEKEWVSVNKEHFGECFKWNTTRFTFKATDNGETVGVIFGKHESGTVLVENIIVSKDRRRQGIGTKLIEKTGEFGRKFGDHKIWLITGKDYPEDPFFSELGFKVQAILPDHYFHKDFKVYTKDIEN